MTKERESERVARFRNRVTLKRNPKGVRSTEPLKRKAKGRAARYYETNKRYPLREILRAKESGRRMVPQTRADYW